MLRTADTHAAAADAAARVTSGPAATGRAGTGRLTAVVTAGLAGAAALLVAAPALAGGGTQVAGSLVRYENAPPVAATAPEGASARVHSVETANGRLHVTLHVSGLQPLTRYGAHAHTSPCGPSRIDPVLSSAALSSAWLALALSGLAPDRDPLLVATAGPPLLCLLVSAVAAAALLRQRRAPFVSGSPA